ncbi:MAG TPA: UdgX family uracil-DNA binding protein [Intrasporangium sp.]|uniref:UdgX family uracil-DNA binding protein n=1 Tax=Intrasporangium sp. TaxID=1925024 RepID=UPI002B47EDB1|nr:UdgX family uracil-DNA binding protein [Intrasporangium sp.]HKX69562.1 UdgX family uracil-DNA binding protein [Intrasporangium sp.]
MAGTADEYPGAEPFVPHRPTLRRLREAVDGCRGCDLYRDATQGVMGDGPVPARLMLIGEQPGDKEDLAGLPFVGPAGRLLDRALGEAGMEAGDAFRTNVVKHFRHVDKGGKRIHKTPVRWQVAACEPWLLTELGLVKPEVVVILGSTAGQAIYGPAFRVGEARGRPLEWPGGDATGEPSGFAGLSLDPPPVAVATAHPSSVLRSRQREVDRAALVRDLAVAKDLLDRR